MSNSFMTNIGRSELGMFLDLPGQSDGTNRHISASSVDWWSQIGLGGSGIWFLGFGKVCVSKPKLLFLSRVKQVSCVVGQKAKNHVFDGSQKGVKRLARGLKLCAFCSVFLGLQNPSKIELLQPREPTFFGPSKMAFLENFRFWNLGISTPDF